MTDQTAEISSPYNPSLLLDALHAKLKLKNDAALCRALEVAPPIISKIRHGRANLSSSLLLRVHELTGMHVRELQAIMGDRRAKFRLSSAQGRP
jgi:plasmid maintenance system antidote protein VapI